MKRILPFYSYAWRGVVSLLTLEIAVVSVTRYLLPGGSPPEIITSNAYAHSFLLLHVVGGVIALVLGPLQFVERIRAKAPRLHRTTGKIYAAAVTIGAPAGLMLALGTQAGPIAGVGFAIPAILWPIFTWAGVRAAIEHRSTQHREWMLRSYAVTANAITLRLMLPAAGLSGLPFVPAYRVIAWASWIVTLAFFELYIRRTRLAVTADPVPAIA